MANLTPTPAYTGLLRALEPTDYAVPALWNDLHQVLIDQDAWLRERILATQDGTEMGAGAITDVHLGNRTVTDTNAPASDTNTLTALVSNLANRIKAVTGAASWRDAPATTLAAAKAHADATSGVHGATSAATPSTIIIRDAAGRAKVAAPSASDDIARKADVDAVASGIESSHIGAGGDAHALVTTTVHGFMSSTDKVKLNAYPTTVTNAATANAAMKRDASGRAKVAAPAAQDDIARKLEVDTVQSALDSHKAAGGSQHPTATPSVAGFLSASDKTKLDSLAAIDRQVFTASGTWTKPSYGTFAIIEAWGGGGGGNKSEQGGGGGAYSQRMMLLADLPANVTVTVGAGGAAQAGATPAQPGGASSFGAYLKAGGGSGGTSGGAEGGVPEPDLGGAAPSSYGPWKGGMGGDSTGIKSGAKSLYGGGGGGGASGGTNGESAYGGDGGIGGTQKIPIANGDAGAAPGGGGGGSNASYTAGAGARGEVRVTVV